MSIISAMNALYCAKPNIRRIGYSMRVIAVEHFIGVIWSFLCLYMLADIEPFNKFLSEVPIEALNVFLWVVFLVGCIFMIAGLTISKKAVLGKYLSLFSVVMLLLEFLWLFGCLAYFGQTGMFDGIFIKIIASPVIQAVFLCVFILALIFLYLGMRYIIKAKINSDESGYQAMLTDVAGFGLFSKTKYHDSYFPCDCRLLNNAIFISIGVIGLISTRIFGSNGLIVTVPLVVGFFITAILYNEKQSSFQVNREVLAKWDCRGVVFVWGGGVIPLFRLISYKDGLEVRVMFQRYFIPYDKIDRLSSLNDRCLLLVSDLPGVPQDIRLYGRNMKAVENQLVLHFLGKRKK